MKLFHLADRSKYNSNQKVHIQHRFYTKYVKIIVIAH